MVGTSGEGGKPAPEQPRLGALWLGAVLFVAAVAGAMCSGFGDKWVRSIPEPEDRTLPWPVVAGFIAALLGLATFAFRRRGAEGAVAVIFFAFLGAGLWSEFFQDMMHPPHGKGSHEYAAISGLRDLAVAQALFREGDKDENGVRDYAAGLEALGKAGLVKPRLARGHTCPRLDRGYSFRIIQAAESSWSAVADPVTPGRSGDRYFFVDESGVIRFSTTGSATSSSTAIGG